MTEDTKDQGPIEAQQEWCEADYKQQGLDAQRLYPNEEFVRFIGRHFFPIPREDRKDVAILEIGCGTGANLWILAKEGFEAHGIDFAPTAISLCEETMGKWGVRFQSTVGNMLDLDYPNARFDAVADVFSATHLPFSLHEQMYQEASRVLKTGGRFFSYHPSDQSYDYIRGGEQIYEPYTVSDSLAPRAPYQGNGVMCFLPEAECRSLLEKTGFKNIKIERIGRTYENGEVYFEFLSVDAEKA